MWLFLDQDRIVEAEAMVEAAAATHRAYFSNARNPACFSRAAECAFSCLRLVDVVRG